MANDTSALLTLHDIGVRFGGLPALDGVSFNIPRGAIKGLIGPNGAGKSTLFNTISGNTAPTSGTIHFDGARIDTVPMARRAQRGIARTFQNLQLFGQQTVLENVMVGCHPRTHAGLVASILRTPAQRREERAIYDESMAALDTFGLADRAHRLAGTLSFGEAKIVEIARAIVSRPMLMLLDEPVAGVPHGEVEQVIAAIDNVNRAGVTLLLVEHNLGFVMSLCDELVVLDHGCLIADGEAEAVVRDPAVLTAYLGEELADA
ncbi:ABC transporter ATP-binding protein (plasmid) [Paraburkholderia sp. PREW-6R]|uniref:ABC transporter ATP-binding protein n=1 Tax=Paraburkholderia sp. PREW-6R TaxID=3141544 RepID=UPI0031F542C0